MGSETKKAADGNKKRRIVDLQVDEVSNVDRPAIQRQFLIVKRLENGMAASDTEVTDGEFGVVFEEVTKSLEAAGFSFLQVDVEKVMPEDLAMALKATVPWMRRMAGEAEGDTRKAILRVVAFLSQVSSGAFPSPNSDKQKAAASAKENLDMGKKTAEEEEKDAKKAAEEEDEEKKKKAGEDEEDEEKKKADEDEEDEEKKKKTPKSKALSLDDDVTDALVEKVFVAMSKGRRFTPKRTATIAESAKNMLGLLKEADEEAYKALVAGLDDKTKKADDEEEDEEKGKGGVKKALDGIAERLTAIEKSRSPSQSVEGDGGTDTEVKKKEGLWGGIL